MEKIKKINPVLFFLCVYVLNSYFTCNRDLYPTSANPGSVSITTGVRYNKEDSLTVKYKGHLVTGNGVRLDGGVISLSDDFKGGVYLLGAPPRRARNVTVGPMVVDRTPVTNIAWMEMIDWLKKFAPKDFYKKLLCDASKWARELSYNDPSVKQYSTHPAYWFHPVCCISWVQAYFYCFWRTFRTNLNIIEKMKNYDLWNDFKNYTVADIADCDLEEVKDYDIAKFANLKLSELAPKSAMVESEEEELEEEEEGENEEENVQTNKDKEGEEEEQGEGEQSEEVENEPEEGEENKNLLENLKSRGLLLCSHFRMPTKAEFAYYTEGAITKKISGGAVARGAIPDLDNHYYDKEAPKDYYNGTQKDLSAKAIASSKAEGIIVRNQKANSWSGVRVRDTRGRIVANFKQGSGVYADGGITSRVYKYPPNAYGIFCFVGVSEFLLGIYREISAEEYDDLNPIMRKGGNRDNFANYDNDPTINDRTRMFIGPNYQDTLSIGRLYTRATIETDKYSYVGFRCVQSINKID